MNFHYNHYHNNANSVLASPNPPNALSEVHEKERERGAVTGRGRNRIGRDGMEESGFVLAVLFSYALNVEPQLPPPSHPSPYSYTLASHTNKLVKPHHKPPFL
jgi:hypothetical protein